MEAGTYTLNYHRQFGLTPFPPSDADAANFFVESIQFEVLAAVSVDATSTYGLLLLVLLVLTFNAYHAKKLKNSHQAQA